MNLVSDHRRKESIMPAPFSLLDTYVLLEGSAASDLEGGPAFWDRLATDVVCRERVSAGWLVGSYTVDRSWDKWEMHPEGDEIVSLVDGRVVMIIEADDGTAQVPMIGGQTVVVPRGTWHSMDVIEPGHALHVTSGRDTRHRPR
jgi:mannose-6-phosphate isomerase-like protein (cupin superfamily)